jgi:RNA polymerase sigma-54 factor
MLILENHVTNTTSLSLNHYLYHGIKLFKASNFELTRYIRKACNDNPLMHMDEGKIPLEVLSYNHSSQADSIMDELLMHFNCCLSSPDREIMHTLLYSLNSSGFLETFPKEVSELLRIPVNKVNENIDRLKSYENLGIGCLDAKEFLEFQLRLKDEYDEACFSLFFDHLDDIHQGQYGFLDDAPMDINTFEDYMEVIKNCSLSPLMPDTNVFIEPDAHIETTSDRTLKIKLSDYLMDDIVFEPIHLRTDDPAFNETVRRYRQEYEELLSIVNARTLYLKQVLSVIIHVQKEYLLKEKGYLNPLNQTELADQTGLSPATISRLMTDKYISTPRGILPIRALLSKKVTGNISASFVRYMISHTENFRTISDSRIAEQLKQYDIHISRRTVNKYKNELLSGL